MKLNGMFANAVGASLALWLCGGLPARALTIQLDYTYDVADAFGGGSFFSGNLAARAALEKAAADLGAAISPSLGVVTTDVFTGTSGSTDATFDWRLSVENPVSGATVSLNTFSFAADTVKIYVGMRSISGTALGQGGPAGVGVTLNGSGSGSEWAAAVADAEARSNAAMLRGGGPVIGTITDSSSLGSGTAYYSIGYGAMAGSLWFDNDSNNDGQIDSAATLDSYWHFDATTAVSSGQNDFYSVALHELMHAIGFGTSDTWSADQSGTDWLGANAITLNGGSGANLVTTGGHIRQSYMSQRLSDGVAQEVAMDPTLTVGTRKSLTVMDVAFLRDLGYASSTGALRVNLAPASAVAAGAQWKVDSGSWQNNGAVVSDLTATNHTVSFKPVLGWNPPTNQVVAIGTGQTNTITGTYTKAGITSPADGSVFNSRSVAFNWGSIAGASQYALWVGTTPGGAELYAGVEGGNLSRTVAVAPNGGGVYARLWAMIGGLWQAVNDYSYTAAPTPAKATMLSPASGSTNGGASVTFNWSAGTNASQYALWVGSASNGYDLYAADESTNLSRTVTLPVNGRKFYVRLWTCLYGDWQGNDYTYTAYSAPAAKATMLSPVNGSTNSSASMALNWSTGTNVSQYALWVGSASNSADLYGAVVGTNLTRTVTGLPVDGRSLFVRLWSFINGEWLSNDYGYRALTARKAQFTGLVNGATLGSGSVTLNWDGGAGASQYALWVGNALGAYDLGAFGPGTNLSQALSGLPTDGRLLYVRLWSLINGGWQWEECVYTAYSAPTARAQMLSPPNGSTNGSTSVTFRWDAGLGVSQYALWVGSASNGSDLFSSILGTNLSRTLNLPATGGAIYVRLWSQINGNWQYNDYSYRMPLPARAQMLSPVNGSTNGSTSVTFTWDAGLGASQYALWVGSALSGHDLYSLLEGISLADTLSLPATDGMIFVRLWSLINGNWDYYDYSYAMPSPGKAQMLSPANFSTNSSTAVTFTWSGGVGASQYALWLGSAANGHDLYAQSEGTNLSRTITVPSNGLVYYARLWSLINGEWRYNDYNYTAPPPRKAALLGATASGSTMTFTWDAGAGVSRYGLWVGRTPGGLDIYAADEGANLSRGVTMPIDGNVYYARLWSLINGVWEYNDYSVPTPLPEKAAMVSPVNGTANSSTSVTFTWTSGLGVSQYALWVGKTLGGTDLVTWGPATSRTQTLTVPFYDDYYYVRLWSLVNGDWQSTDYTYQAPPSQMASLTSPNVGTTIVSYDGVTSQLPCAWTAGVGVSEYWLGVGTAPGTYNIYAASQGMNRSRTVTIPWNVSTFYVRVGSRINGVWQFEDSTHTFY
jgi:hypothetical protein